ncbi:MAG: hypothetical protein JKY00_13540 [Roseicyclus sp.]|nr:hypothetical protein [Roseicyclus sp.]
MGSPENGSVADECMGFDGGINSHDADVMEGGVGKAVGLAVKEGRPATQVVRPVDGSSRKRAERRGRAHLQITCAKLA